MTDAAGTTSVSLFGGPGLRARERRTEHGSDPRAVVAAGAAAADRAPGPGDEVAPFPPPGGG